MHEHESRSIVHSPSSRYLWPPMDPAFRIAASRGSWTFVFLRSVAEYSRTSYSAMS
jgi:hypothetical protein